MTMKIPTPNEIFEYLDEHVIGQEEPKRMLANLGYIHAAQKAYKCETQEQLRKCHGLLLGPSGSGKTYMVEKMAEYLGMPFIHIDASQLTPSGYVGQDLHDYLSSGYKSGGHNECDFNHCIIFIDEIDKICIPQGEGSMSGFYKQAQYNILRALEGTRVLPYDGSSKGFSKEFQTHGMLFILGGAFGHVLKDMDEKATGKGQMGFNPEAPTQMTLLQALQKHNVSTQLVGRMTAVSRLNRLTKPELERIAKNSKDSLLGELNKLALITGQKYELGIHDLTDIVDSSEKNKVGARGLRQGTYKSLEEKIFDAPVPKYTPEEKAFGSNKENATREQLYDRWMSDPVLQQHLDEITEGLNKAMNAEFEKNQREVEKELGLEDFELEDEEELDDDK